MENDYNENDLFVEFADNPDPRCPCILLLDVSSSMTGKPIEALNEGLKTFHEEVTQDELASRRVELGIITFGSGVDTIQDFVTVDQFNPPTLTTSGTTSMGTAIKKGLDMIADRKEIYNNNGIAYYRPWLFLITDGHPTDEWESAAKRLKIEDEQKKVAFFAVGVEGADMSRLAKISPPSRVPLKLKGLNFSEMFVWLSTSLRSVSSSTPGDQVPLSTPEGWASV